MMQVADKHIATCGEKGCNAELQLGNATPENYREILEKNKWGMKEVDNEVKTFCDDHAWLYIP